jgi:hypothetical protein
MQRRKAEEAQENEATLRKEAQGGSETARRRAYASDMRAGSTGPGVG